MKWQCWDSSKSLIKAYAFALIPLWKLKMSQKRKRKAENIQEVVEVKSQDHSFITHKQYGKTNFPLKHDPIQKPNLTAEPSMFFSPFQRLLKCFLQTCVPSCSFVCSSRHREELPNMLCKLVTFWYSSGINPGPPSFLSHSTDTFP